jgi:diguanylate cyclase (GGDEF)-like protein
VAVIRLLLVSLGLLLWLGEANAFSISGADSQNPATGLTVLEDPSGDLSLAEARRRDDWTAFQGGNFNAGYTQSAWWLRFKVHNPLNKPQERLLAIDYPVLGDLRVFHLRGNEQIEYRMGFNYPFNQRPIDTRAFAVPLRWDAGQTTEIYIRVQSESSVQVPLTLWKAQAFHSSSAYENLAHGIFFGTLIAIAIYNLLLYFSLRDINYLLYVASVVSLVLLIGTINGFTFRFLWPQSTSWNSQALEVFISMAVGFSALFTRQFLVLRKSSPLFNRIMLGIAVTSAIICLASFRLSYFYAISFLIPFTVFACSSALLAGVVTYRRGQETARYYLMAWSFLLIGLLVLALSKAGVLPSNALTDVAGQIGSMFEVILLSFALAQRISNERKLRFAAQEQLLEESHRHNQELEQRVHERTVMLEKLNQQLNELSVTDGLTGLKNRRFFDDTLRNELHRARRTGRPLSLALMDIDHFKPLNDHFGHQAGDECLRRVGEVLRAHVRKPSDIAARYGGEEFALILPETDPRTAATVLERLRRTIQETRVEYEGETLRFTISLGFTTSSDSTTSADEMIRQADHALYQAKEDGRNKVIRHSLAEPQTSAGEP